MEKHEPEALMQLMHLVFDDIDTPVTPEQLQPYLNKHMRLRRLKKAEVIVSSGQPVRYMHIMLAGGAYIMRHTANGSYATIARVPAPDLIGNVQIFSKDPLFYSDIVASNDTLMLEIEQGYYRQCVAACAPLALLNLSIMSGAQQRSSMRLEVTRIPDSADKLVVYIYRRWVEKGLPEKTLRISDKHATIASDIGISVRTLYRAINKLEEDGGIAVEKGGVLVVTHQQLEAIAQRYRQVMVPWD